MWFCCLAEKKKKKKLCFHFSCAWAHAVVSSLGWESTVFFFSSSEKQQRALSNKPRLCNHCHVSGFAFLCLCFCWYWSWQPLAGGRRFKPEGSAPYQRLIATLERGIAPGKEKKKHRRCKEKFGPSQCRSAVFLFFFYYTGRYGDECQRWTNCRTLAVSSTSRSQCCVYFNGCWLVDRKRLIKEETPFFHRPCVFVSQPRPTTVYHCQAGPG